MPPAAKVYVSTAEGEYTVRLRLYELENRLDRSRFVRISHSEMINLGKARGFDLSLAGTIRVTLEDGTACWVSRRYVSRIRQCWAFRQGGKAVKKKALLRGTLGVPLGMALGYLITIVIHWRGGRDGMWPACPN